MTITLAPMEGVVDVHMRNMMTMIGGYDLCVTEFCAGVTVSGTQGMVLQILSGTAQRM